MVNGDLVRSTLGRFLNVHPKRRAQVSGGTRKTTNNRMEICAAIAGLEMLKRPCQVTLNSDSQYLWCPKCQTTYTVEGAKRAVEQAPSMF